MFAHIFRRLEKADHVVRRGKVFKNLISVGHDHHFIVKRGYAKHAPFVLPISLCDVLLWMEHEADGAAPTLDEGDWYGAIANARNFDLTSSAGKLAMGKTDDREVGVRTYTGHEPDSGNLRSISTPALQ